MITAIQSISIASDTALADGRYLVDKDNPHADLHRVVRRLEATEDYVDAYEALRSDDAAVVEIDGETGRKLWGMY
jgi:hypothetical protein